MKWFLVILAVLKYTGIVLLAVLLFLVLVLLILLLCSIKYEAQGEYNEGLANGAGFVSYMFGLIRFEFSYKEGSFGYKLKVPFYNSLKKKSIKKANNTSAVTPAEDDRTVTIMSKTDVKQPECKTEQNNKSDDKTAFFNKKKFCILNRFKRKAEKKPKERSILDKITYYYKKYEVKSFYKPFKRFLKRFFKSLGINFAEADVCFGFDDPSLTGVVLGGGTALSAFLPVRLNLNGFFEGEYLCGKGNIKGKTCIIAVIIPIIKLVFEKPVWKLLMNLKG